MTPKPGTSLMIYAAVTPLVLAGFAVSFPLLAFPLSAAPIFLLFSPNASIVVWLDQLYVGAVLPSPVLVVGHACFLAGAWCFNKGNRAVGFGLLGYASAALVLYMIPVCLMAALSLLLGSGNRTVLTLSVLVPAIYMGSLVAVLATTVRIGDNLELGRQIPRWAFSRRLGIWSAVAAMPVVVSVVAWRVATVPQHQFSIVNETGRPIYLSTVGIADFVDDFRDSYVFPFQKTTPQLGGRRRFTVRGEILLADFKLRFRFNMDEPVREYVATVYSSWYIDCSFEITVRQDRIDASECHTENRREGID